MIINIIILYFELGDEYIKLQLWRILALPFGTLKILFNFNIFSSWKMNFVGTLA